MAERPDIISAKMEKLLEILSNQEELKGRPKANRPSEASLDEIRNASNQSIQDLLSENRGVSHINNVDIPGQKLQDGG